jgi:predicted RNA-binding protein with PIN domain
VTVVFDGSDVPGPSRPRRPGVRVLFSAPGESADDVVVREVDALPLDMPVMVVSSDRELRRRVGALGALTVPVDAFSEVLRG